MKPFPQAPKLSDLMDEIQGDRLIAVFKAGEVIAVPRGRYRHWANLQQLKPPNGLNHREWWLGVKIARSQLKKHLPLKNAAGRSFHYVMADPVQEMLHQIDQKAGGQIAFSEEATNPETRDRYILNSLIEEAITSSQLEGAATTRQVASDMLRSGRKPRDISERMILNNYEAIQHTRKLGKRIEPRHVLELHRILTVDTLEDPATAGRLQTSRDERVSVVDNVTHRVLHIPPPAEQLPHRLEQMCAFANGELPKGAFLHPVLRAVILHFWLGYDHPFADGNGRTARALFYWSMLTSGYWLFEYVSISRILKDSYAAYGTSYLHSESDENDCTYFIVHQLKVMMRAIEELEKYIQKKISQLKAVESKLRGTSSLNHRQLALLSHALRHPGKDYDIKSHQRSHNVAYATARADLLDLASKQLLEKRRIGGKTLSFLAPNDIRHRIESLA